jgi:exodeoxyribonuclease V gamma subunit
MLHLRVADQVGPLAGALAEVLAEPPTDPMTPDWVAVPTLGMHRWLGLELARSLGASGPDAGDGVAANITFTFPGALRQAVLGAGRSAGGDVERGDPWQVEHLAWAVLDVLHAGRADDRLGPLTSLAPGATWFGRARRLADLFDRYAVRRPDLVLHWNAGRDIDATGRLLSEYQRWQPHLWRLTRARIGEPSPPERLPALLDALRAGTLAVDLPPRLAVFGVTTLPGGAPFVELADAVAAHRDLHLFLLDPSPTTTARVRGAAVAAPPAPDLLRSDDRSEHHVHHPLARSWGRPYRERAVLLAAAEPRGVPEPRPVETHAPAGGDEPCSLLVRIQHDLRADVLPAGDFDLDPDDRSIQVHSCHGQARQVEVLRDAILHLVADDPTLREEDIVVLCPAIDQFAPLVEAGLGPSVEMSDAAPSGATPRLLYRITDRSLRESYPVLAALDALLELISGRCTASEMLEFLSLAPVRERFDFDDGALGTIDDWIGETNVRWGFDGQHRARWDIPPELTANSWRVAVDRVLMGVAVSDDEIALAPDDIAPLGVEGSGIAVAGRFADVVARLAAIADDMTRPRTAAAWCDALSDASGQLFDVEADQQWQLEQLWRIIAEIGDGAVVGDEPAAVELTLADVRRLLADRLQGAPRRPDFFRGGITISSLTPLRWLPFRVVCLLGFDDAGTSTGTGLVDGDDLAALAPRLGDRDPRSEVRQALLEAVLAAGDRLIVTRTGHNIRTNQEVPSAVAFAELRDTLTATLSPGSRGAYRGQIETVHPRQPFDDRCFEPGALHRPGPWGFDAGALAGARARAERVAEDQPFMEGPLAPEPCEERVITLTELRSFLDHPVKAFLRRRLRIHLPGEDPSLSDDLPTSLDALERWSVADRLITARLAGHSTAEWERHERALGTLPAGGLGDASVGEIKEAVDALLDRAEALGVDQTLDDQHPVDIELAGGIRIVGVVDGRCASPNPGPATVTFSRAKPKQHVAAWLDLMALVATDPRTSWRSVVVRRAERGDALDALELIGRGDTPEERHARALAALEVAVDCYQRGLCEPIPLFATISRKLDAGDAEPKDWLDFNGFGEGYDEAHQLAFGGVDLHDLRAVPARDDDPRGSSRGRADRFAHHLWRAIDESTETAGMSAPG